MAQPLSTDGTVFFVDFANGNDFTPSTYVTYADDLDVDLLAIRTSVNQVIDEVSAIGGPNAVVSIDIITADDVGALISVGVIGSHSYSFAANGAAVDVEAGTALVAGTQRVSSTSVVSPTYAGAGPATVFVAIDLLGVPTIEEFASSQALDLGSITWTGAVFTGGTEVRLADILPDGDDLIAARKRAVNGGWAVKSAVDDAFQGIAPRLQSIETAITGFSTDSEGDAVSTIGIRGSAALPGMVTTDGTSTRDTTTGLYRAALNQLGVSASGVVRAIFGSFGIRMISGAAATPSVAGNSFTTTGLYWIAGPTLGLSVGGVSRATITAALFDIATTARVNIPAGVVGTPGLTLGDATSGVYANGTDSVAVANAAGLTADFTADGFLNLPTQPRVRVVNAAESIAYNAGLTFTNIPFTDGEEIYDVGGFKSGTTADFTVPTGGTGTYEAKLNVVFVANSTGQRRIAIEFNGVSFGEVLVDAMAAGVTAMSTSVELDITAAQVIRAQAGQSETGTGALNAAVEFTIRKVA